MATFPQSWLRRVAGGLWAVLVILVLAIVANLLTNPVGDWLNRERRRGWLVTVLRFAVDNLPATLWIVAAIVFIVLVVAAFVEERRSGRVRSRVFFSPDRESLPSLTEQMKGVRIGWVVWPSATQESVRSEFRGLPIQRLILLDPDGMYLKAFAHGYNTTPDHLAGTIRFATDRAREVGVRDIRWFDGPVISLILADPNDETGWAQLEILTPFRASDDRPSFRFTKRDYPQLFETLMDAYESMWRSNRTREPMAPRLNP